MRTTHAGRAVGAQIDALKNRGGATSSDELINMADSLRNRYGFGGSSKANAEVSRQLEELTNGAAHLMRQGR